MSPNPEQALAALDKRLATKGFPSCILLYGPEDYFRDKGLRLVRQHARDMDLVQWDSSNRADFLSAFSSDLLTPSLFTGAKVIVLREDLKFLGEKEVVDRIFSFLAKPVPGVHLVLMVKDKLDQKNKLLNKVISSRGIAVFCRELYSIPFPGRKMWDTELHRWVMGEARKRGMEIRADDSVFLVSVIGKTPGRIEGFLERMKVYLEGKPGAKPTRALMERMLGPGGESNQFELARAILKGDFKKAIVCAREIMETGIRDEEGTPLDSSGALLVSLAWVHVAARRVFRALILEDRGCSREEIEERLGVVYFKEDFWEEVKSASIPGLAKILEALVNAHKRIKVQGERPERVMESFVMEAMI